MTSRERVRKALNHEEADRLPVNFGGSCETSIHVDAYCELINYLGIDPGPPKVYDQFQMLPRIEGLMSFWFGTDVIELENLYTRLNIRNKDWKEWTTFRGNKVLMPGEFDPITDPETKSILARDPSGKIVAEMPDNGFYFDWYGDMTDYSKDIVLMPPEEWKNSIALYGEEELTFLQRHAKFMYENTVYSIHGAFSKGSLGGNTLWAGNTITNWLSALILEPEYVKEVLEATAERACQNLRLYLDAVGRYIDTILVSSYDYGIQRYGGLFSADVFRELYKPSMTKINNFVHENSNIKVFYHTCGSACHIMDDLIESGVDVLNPVQTSAEGMDPALLKENYGDKLTFCGGGSDTQLFLPYATPEEVREHVKERIRIFAPGGGFIFNTDTIIQYGVPPQNIEAIVETVKEFGRYPISC